MELDNFKELLLRKSADNEDLQLLIKYIKDDYLVDHVVESLEKMAASDANRKTNSAVKHFGTHMDEHVEGEMIHDQLSHHASHYKAALKAGEKDVADQHMKKIFNTMYMLQKVTRDGKENHTDGKLTASAVDPKPWEENLKHDKTSDTYGWKEDRTNWDHMRQAPHAGRPNQLDDDGNIKKKYKKDRYLGEIKGHGHDKSYPLEEIKINDKHIHIDDDIEHSGKFEEHSFDSHPIIEHSRTANKHHNEDAHSKYLEAHDSFHDEGGGADNYWDMVDTRDPKAHAARGSSKSDPVHHEVNNSKDFVKFNPGSGGETPDAAVSSEALKASDRDAWESFKGNK